MGKSSVTIGELLEKIKETEFVRKGSIEVGHLD